ncbi:MAG: 50S ribosomal protein L24e [archaeon]
MAKCSFCGEQIEEGKGIIYVTNDSRVHNFCSSKCRKNKNLGRIPKKVKWIRKKKK